RFGGRTRNLKLGDAATSEHARNGALTLAAARVRAAEARHQLERGVDPAAHRAAAHAAPGADDSVEALVAQFLSTLTPRRGPAARRPPSASLTRSSCPRGGAARFTASAAATSSPWPRTSPPIDRTSLTARVPCCRSLPIGCSRATLSTPRFVPGSNVPIARSPVLTRLPTTSCARCGWPASARARSVRRYAC